VVVRTETSKVHCIFVFSIYLRIHMSLKFAISVLLAGFSFQDKYILYFCSSTMF
jgi:hypothetical protein